MVTFQEAPPLLDEPEEQPLLAPVTQEMSWEWVHGHTQQALRPDGSASVVTIMRRTATIRTGTRMIKLFTGRQLGGYLFGRLPSGFCYRAYDLSHLRTSTDLALLTVDATAADAVFALRWRAVDPRDYHIPFSAGVADLPVYAGIANIRPHDRMGAPVLGTGFAPSSHHIVPEFVTADFADIPLTANASLVAFTPDGQEVTLYTYLPEQRAWTRMFGPQWKHLLAGLTDLPPDQEYLPIAATSSSTMVGSFRGQLYEAIADPPHEYRVHARARAARYPVDTLARRTTYASWRGMAVTIVRVEGEWLRVRLCRPDENTTPLLGAQCLERGIYEAWANANQVSDVQTIEFAYELNRPSSSSTMDGSSFLNTGFGGDNARPTSIDTDSQRAPSA